MEIQKNGKLLIIFFLVFCCVACGKKAPPVPPESTAPKTISNLEVLSETGVLVLQWNLFPKGLDSGKTDTIGGVYVLTASEIDDYCPLCPKDFKKTAIPKTEHIKTHTKKHCVTQIYLL